MAVSLHTGPLANSLTLRSRAAQTLVLAGLVGGVVNAWMFLVRLPG